MSVLANVKRISTPLLFTAAVVASQFSMVLPAAAAGGTATWTGNAGDGKFSTAGNWAEAAIPEDGDELIFNSDAEGGNETVENDLTGVAFSKVTVDDTGLTDYSSYNVTGNPLELQDGASLEEVNSTYNLSASLNGGIQGAGSLILKNWGTSKGTINGELSAEDSYGVLGGEYGIKGLTSLVIAGNTSFSVEDNLSFPITVQPNASAYLSFYAECAKFEGYKCIEHEGVTRTVSGDLTLNANLTVTVGPKVTAKFTGDKSGSGKVIRDKYSSAEGVLIVGGKKLENPTITTKLSGSKTGYETGAYVTIVDNETGILSGKRENISVLSGGLLKGEGTTNFLYVDDGGMLAPGNSPGKITVLDTFTLVAGSTYQAEILDAKNYDQIVAENVDVTGATLELSFLKGGSVAKGDKFTLINNTGNDPITGTFSGIDEGDKITLGDAVFAVTYEGGSGNNNFVLTALNDAVAPGTPNTGFHALTLANPMIVAVMGLAAAGGVLYLRRSTK